LSQKRPHFEVDLSKREEKEETLQKKEVLVRRKKRPEGGGNMGPAKRFCPQPEKKKLAYEKKGKL